MLKFEGTYSYIFRLYQIPGEIGSSAHDKAGWTEEQVLNNYPTLTKQSLRAVFAFSSECMREEFLYAISSG